MITLLIYFIAFNFLEATLPSLISRLSPKNLKGLDWVAFIDEPQRQYFLRELESCSEKIRELSFETISTEGEAIKFSGFPYRDNNRNFGFLIYLEQEK